MRNNKKTDFRSAALRVYNHFIGHSYPGGKVILGRNISNPFLPAPQQTPSFNVFRASDGNLVYKDFATSDKGNCVSFVSKLKGVSRIEAIRIIRKLTTNNLNSHA